MKKTIFNVSDEDHEDDFRDFEIIEIEGDVDVYREGNELVIVKKGYLN